MSSSQSSLPENTQHSMPSGWIRTHNLSRGAAADVRLRPRGYWDRQYVKSTELNIKVKVKVKQSCYRPGVAQRVPGS